MRVAVFSTKPYERAVLDQANERYGHELTYFESRLSADTAGLASGFEAVCLFVSDAAGRDTLERLAQGGTRLLALRSAGFNHVDLQAAAQLDLCVVRVPAYSPHAVAEHTVALILALNRKVCRAYGRVRESNFALEGLLGFDMYGKTAGVVGAGKIGLAVSRILTGFGCNVLAFDPSRNPETERAGAKSVSMDVLLGESDIVTLHCPLTPQTYHLIDASALDRMKPGVMVINTSRGALIDTRAVIRALKSGRIGYLGLDVYEEEADLFFEDLSGQVLQDDTFARLLTFPNVVITGHQAFFTREALENIAQTTLENITEFERDGGCRNRVSADRVRTAG